MEIGEFNQLRIDQLPSSVDLFLSASGYEERASYAAERLDFIEAGRKVAVGFAEQKVLARAENDRRFQKEGFQIVESRGDEMDVVRRIVGDTVRAPSDGERSTLLIDYTSMTRVWYAGVLRELRQTDRNEDLRVIFVYCPSEYSEPHPPPPNASIRPIPGFSSLQLPRTRIALVVGLGYERDRARGLVEYIEPSRVYAFLSSPAVDGRFEADVRDNNSELLGRLRKTEIIEYPIMDLQSTANRLNSVVVPLRDEFRVVLAPQGPKPFTLLSLLVSMAHSRIDVWRVSGGYRDRPYDRKPDGRLLVASLEMKKW